MNIKIGVYNTDDKLNQIKLIPPYTGPKKKKNNFTIMKEQQVTHRIKSVILKQKD